MIQSKDNESVKSFRKLHQRKYREAAGKFVVENLITLDTAVREGFFPAELFVSEECVSRKDLRVERVLAMSGKVYLVSETVSRSLSSQDTPSGIYAIFQKPSERIDPENSVLYLNGIRDPGNMGTIFRTALAFGMKNIVVDEYCVDVYNPKAVSAMKDAIFKINLSFDKDGRVLASLKTRMPVLCTRTENAIELGQFSFPSQFCIVLGSEAHGVSPQIEAVSEVFLRIEHFPEMESLNVAVSSGIILYRIRQFFVNTLQNS